MTNWYEGTNNVVAGVARAMANGDNLYIAQNVNVGSTGNDGVTSAGDANVSIYGALFSLAGFGLASSAGDVFLTVGAGGSVNGVDSGISLIGQENVVINDGSISGGGGMFFNGVLAGNNSLANTGQIDGTNAPAVYMTGGGNHISNRGEVTSTYDTAIFLDSAAVDGGNVIDNSGTIAAGLGSGVAIHGGDAVTEVNNAGRIEGEVQFGTSNDTYDGELGVVIGIIIGGGGDDTLLAGVGRNHLQGGSGSDTLDGGAGRDVFIYAGVSDSGGGGSGGIHDTILGFDARKDKFDLSVNVTGVDATVATGALTTANFATDVKNAVGAAQLAAHHAVLFTATSGDLAGHTILVVDANGSAGFQTGNKDFVFDLTDADNLGNLGRGDFI